MNHTSSINSRDLERIYELTYKYGMLLAIEREENWLPDRAYIEKQKIGQDLGELLHKVVPDMMETYSAWMEDHDPRGYERLWEYLNHVTSILESDPKWEEELSFIQEAEEYIEFFKEILPEITDDATKHAINDALEYYNYLEKINSRIQDAYVAMEEAVEENNLDKMIISFQQALNTAHQSGEMAEFVLSDYRNAKKILDDLSAGRSVPQWNQEITSWTGRQLSAAVVTRFIRMAQVMAGPPATTKQNPDSQARGCFMCGWTSDFTVDVAAGQEELKKCPKCGAELKKGGFAINPAIGDTFDMQPSHSARTVSAQTLLVEDLVKSVQKSLSEQGMPADTIEKIVTELGKNFPQQNAPQPPKAPATPEKVKMITPNTVTPTVTEPLQENKIIKPMQAALDMLAVWAEPERINFGKDYVAPSLAEATEELPARQQTSMTKEELQEQVANALGVDPQDLKGVPVREAINEASGYSDINIIWDNIAHLLDEVF